MKVALLSDIHGNLTALEAVLTALAEVDELWVTGDTAGYGPDPSDVVALLRSRGARLIAGNHDRAVATGSGLELFNPDAAAAARLHQQWLSADERDFLGGLPETDVRGAFSLCHGSFRDPLWEYVFTAAGASASLARATTAHGCCGHTHVPAVFSAQADGSFAGSQPRDGDHFEISTNTLLNPGSVGQPRDGDPRSSYAVLDTAAMSVTFHRAAYDVEAVRARIHSRKLPPVLGDRLVYGL